MAIKIFNKVSDELKAKRKAICNKCPYRKELTNTCGIPIIGGVIIHNGLEVKLCGCFINEKTKYAIASCDIENW